MRQLFFTPLGGARRFLYLCTVLPLSGVLLTIAPTSRATPIDPVVRVEEDWELVLNQPNGAVTAPQFHTIMSPYGNLDSLFAQVTWNYRELGTFNGGGMQMQGWNGEVSIVERSFLTEPMSNAAETVRWTQTLETNGTQMTFLISNGQSTTWGTFGYPGNNMKINASIELPTLNTYSTDVSVQSSGISFGTNRVERLAIREVRWYGPSGLLSVDTTPHVLFERD